MEISSEMVSTTLPAKFLLPSQVIKISLLSARDYLSRGLSDMENDFESVSSIFAMLVQEAMGYGDDFGDIENAVDYALRHPGCSDRNSVYHICANTSDAIYSTITTFIPDWGIPKYTGRYTFTLGENADVYIRLAQLGQTSI